MLNEINIVIFAADLLNPIIKINLSMTLLKSLMLFVCALSFSLAMAQDDQVLFTVEGKQVTVSEFDYIYSKNSGQDTDYSERSLREYLDLYVKFKLKVQRAKELKLDTIPVLQKELEGYRKQLAKSYLTDKEVTERLIKEVYDRSEKDVKISHILFSVPSNATDVQRIAAEEKAQEVYTELGRKMTFDEAVIKYSTDKLSKENGGSLGYLGAMFPSGFYELENAAYELKVGEFSKPVKTKLGYHIVRLDEERDARGEMEIAHILIRDKSKKRKGADPRKLIDSIDMKLKAGADFTQLARKYSEDKNSAENGGYIGYFGINRFEKSFEDAAFSITADNGFSPIFQTSVGYHIIKRISKKPRATYEDAKKILKSKVLKDPRHVQATLSLIDRIKADANFSESPKVLSSFTSQLDKSFFSYKWKVPTLEEKTLFQFGSDTYSLSDFAVFAKNNTRSRLRMDELPIDEAIGRLYKEFIDNSAIDYEEKQLEKKYPDFKAIMREYEEGILLFEVTKMNVWDKASKDSVGLANFYETRKSDYMWKERANTKNYTLETTEEKLVKKFVKKAKKKSPEWLKSKFGDIFQVTEGVYERGSRDLAGIKFNKNAVSSPLIDTRKGTTKFKKIDSVIPPQLKSLGEARGYIEADYQDELEKEWVSILRKKYSVKINEDVFQSLVK